MKCAVIDIGSNSMRLSAYETENGGFKILFKEKIMAGLAGYVAEGKLSKEGIKCACEGLVEFRKILECLNIETAFVFATASLRNISNTDEAVGKIKERTGFEVQVISGVEEAVLGYNGAMRELKLEEGVFADIGGASAEVVYFSQGAVQNAVSIPVGSLKLFSQCVSKIIPKKSEIEKLDGTVKRELKEINFKKIYQTKTLCCVGGTARAVLKLAKYIFAEEKIENSITSVQFSAVKGVLLSGTDDAVNIILKVCPERIHTIIPGIIILDSIVKKFGSTKLLVSDYGVREGYLCQKIQENL
jgi:exopolyphosphatase/guanosine-5'-triphosphate,3'-diphosphate pyrophosphatase